MLSAANTTLPSPPASPDSYTALCSLSRQAAEEDNFGSGMLPLERIVGLPQNFCAAWEDLGAADRSACLHTFENASEAGKIQRSLAEACGNAMGEVTGLGRDKFVQCVLDTSDVPAAECSLALRPLLVLGDNKKAMQQVRRSIVQEGVRRLDPLASNDVERIKTIVHKKAPTLDDVFSLTRLCGWATGSPANQAANQLLAERFLLELPLEDPAGYDRTMCTKANDDCALITSTQQMCHAVQHKFATNAMRLKVEEAGGRKNILPGQQLAAEQLMFPDPYGITFIDMAVACAQEGGATEGGAMRRQQDVAQVLMSSRAEDVFGNANICARIQRTTSTLRPMTEAQTQITSIAAQAS